MEKTKIININAKSTKRIWGFAIDIFFSNFFRMLFLQTFVLAEKNIKKYNDFLANFKETFGSVSFFEARDYHIRYFVESDVFSYFVRFLIIFLFTGVLYNLICYVFLGSTLGQKFLSLKLVNIKDDNKPNIFKAIFKAVLVPLPFIMVFVLSSFTVLYLIKFHIYAPTNNSFAAYIIAKVVKISNPFTAALAAVFFALFWYGFYYLNSKGLLLSDVISRTRVIDVKKKTTLDLLINKNSSSEESKDFVYVLDKALANVERFNRYLNSVLTKWIDVIRKKIGKGK